MKLLTHNMLTSRCLKGVTSGYPLSINATNVRVVQVDFNNEFVSRVIGKIDYKVMREAANSLGYGNDLPEELPEGWDADQDFLRKIHHALLEVEVFEGELMCPETGRKFPINEGIPNMLLNETETND